MLLYLLPFCRKDGLEPKSEVKRHWLQFLSNTCDFFFLFSKLIWDQIISIVYYNAPVQTSFKFFTEVIYG